MKGLIIIFLLIFLFYQYTSAQSYSFKPKYRTILKKDIFKNGSGQHSRYYPKNISGYFNPSKSAIRRLENNFGKILELKSDSCCNPNFKVIELKRFGFQYWGLIIQGKKYIYINAFRLSSDNKISRYSTDWKKKQIVVFDGGTGFWGALYDDGKSDFLELAFNGPPFE